MIGYSIIRVGVSINKMMRLMTLIVQKKIQVEKNQLVQILKILQKNDDVAETKETKETNTNTEEDDKFFDTSMNGTSELEVTTRKNDTEQNKSTTNEL